MAGKTISEARTRISSTPSQDSALTPKITRPKNIKGRNTALEINAWPIAKPGDAADPQLLEIVDQVVNAANP